MTSGILWLKLNELTVSAIDTSGADDFISYYYNGSAWIATGSQTQWDNLQYNNIASGLVTMTAAKYSFQDFYLQGDGTMIMVYGDEEFVSLSGACNADIPALRPDQAIKGHSTYIGRVCFQKSAVTAGDVLTPFNIIISSSSASDHGSLAGLSDDDHTLYLKLTSGRGGQTINDSISILTGNTISIVDTSINTLIYGNGSKNLSSVTLSANFAAAFSGTLDTIQNIQTSSSPTFVSTTLSGLSVNSLIYSNGSKLLADAGVSSNLTFTTGTLDTIQNIQTSSKPSFAGLLLTDTVNINNGYSITWQSGDWYSRIILRGTTCSIGTQVGNMVLNTPSGNSINFDNNTVNKVLINSAGLNIATGSNLSITDISASRLLSSDASKNLTSVADLTSWVAGTSNQIISTTDGDGSLTLSTPQNIHSGASPTFGNLTVGAGNLTFQTNFYLTSNSGASQMEYRVPSGNGMIFMEASNNMLSLTPSIGLLLYSPYQIRAVNSSMTIDCFDNSSASVINLTNSDGTYTTRVIMDSARVSDLSTNTLIFSDASKDLSDVTIGNSLSFSQPTLDTIQDIRITASPTFVSPDCSTSLLTDVITEHTGNVGVTIDVMTLIKDGNIYIDGTTDATMTIDRGGVNDLCGFFWKTANGAKWNYSLNSGNDSLILTSSTLGGPVAAYGESTGSVFFAQAYSDDVGAVRDLLIKSDGQIGYNASTIRSKLNIRPLKDVEWLYKVRPVTFYKRKVGGCTFLKYKNKKLKRTLYSSQKNSNILHMGIVAEELNTLKPDLVYKSIDGICDGVSYKGFITPMIKCIQNQKKDIDRLKKEMMIMKELVKTLQSLIALKF